MLPTYIKDPAGRTWINPAKRNIRPFWLTTEPASVVLAGGAVSDPVIMPIDTQGHFEAFYVVGQSTGAYTISIFDPATSKFWHQLGRELHSDTITGNAQRPFILPESYFFNVEDAARSLVLRFRDLTGLPNTIFFALHGRRIYHREAPPEVQMKFRDMYQRKERTQVYFLTTDAPVVLAGGATNVQVPIRNTDEGDMEVFKLSASSTGPFSFRIRERANNRTLSNEVVHSADGWGTGQFPFVFPETWVIERNFQVILELNDLSGAPNTIFFTLAGRKLYYA